MENGGKLRGSLKFWVHVFRESREFVGYLAPTAMWGIGLCYELQHATSAISGNYV